MPRRSKQDCVRAKPSADETKICQTCGRRFTWQKRWARNWPEVRYCSKRCQGGAGQLGTRLEAQIRTMLAARTGSLCPSEIARAEAPDDWRPLMEPVRQAGRRLAWREEIVITQKGKRVDPSDFRGPVRFMSVRDRGGSRGL